MNLFEIMNLLERFGINSELNKLFESYYSDNKLSGLREIRNEISSDKKNIYLMDEIYRVFKTSVSVNRRINLFPCDDCPPGCCDELVAFAELGFESKFNRGKYGFRSLMANLYPYWFECVRNHHNIIFTSSFDRTKFNEYYLPTFQKFKKVPGRRIIIIEVTKDGLYIQYQN